MREIVLSLSERIRLGENVESCLDSISKNDLFKIKEVEGGLVLGGLATVAAESDNDQSLLYLINNNFSLHENGESLLFTLLEKNKYSIARDLLQQDSFDFNAKGGERIQSLVLMNNINALLLLEDMKSADLNYDLFTNQFRFNLPNEKVVIDRCFEQGSVEVLSYLNQKGFDVKRSLHKMLTSQRGLEIVFLFGYLLPDYFSEKDNLRSLLTHSAQSKMSAADLGLAVKLIDFSLKVTGESIYTKGNVDLLRGSQSTISSVLEFGYLSKKMSF